MRHPSEIAPQDQLIVDAFLDACTSLTAQAWATICRRRADDSQAIADAQERWNEIRIGLTKAARGIPRSPDDQEMQQRINKRINEIAAGTSAPEGWTGKASFPELVRAAISEAVMVLRTFTAIIGQPGASEAAIMLTRSFQGFVDVPQFPAYISAPPKREGRGPSVRRANPATEAAMKAALAQARMPKAGTQSAVTNAWPNEAVLERILANPPGESARSRAAFMSAANDWTASIAGVRPSDIDGLPALPKMIRVPYWFLGDVTTEGMGYFLSESGGVKYWSDLRRGVEAIGAKETLRAITAVEGLFPAGFPKDQGRMQAIISAWDRQDPDPLAQLDDEFDTVIAEEIPRCLYEYLRNGPHEL